MFETEDVMFSYVLGVCTVSVLMILALGLTQAGVL